MNHKQKLGYTGLGALIMLVGIGVGSIVSPPLSAQRNGMFSEIQCTGLTVVDRYGRPAIYLDSREDRNGITLINKAGNLAVSLSANRAYGKYPASHGVTVYDQAGKNGVVLTSTPASNTVHVYREDQFGVVLHAETLLGNHVTVQDQKGDTAVELQAAGRGPNGVFILDKAGNTVSGLQAD